MNKNNKTIWIIVLTNFFPILFGFILGLLVYLVMTVVGYTCNGWECLGWIFYPWLAGIISYPFVSVFLLSKYVFNSVKISVYCFLYSLIWLLYLKSINYLAGLIGENLFGDGSLNYITMSIGLIAISFVSSICMIVFRNYIKKNISKSKFYLATGVLVIVGLIGHLLLMDY